MAPFDGSAWEEEEDESAPPPPAAPDVPYYNNFPGKQPPPGGLIDMRTRPGPTLVRRTSVCFQTQFTAFKLKHRSRKEMTNFFIPYLFWAY